MPFYEYRLHQSYKTFTQSKNTCHSTNTAYTKKFTPSKTTNKCLQGSAQSQIPRNENMTQTIQMKHFLYNGHSSASTYKVNPCAKIMWSYTTGGLSLNVNFNEKCSPVSLQDGLIITGGLWSQGPYNTG